MSGAGLIVIAAANPWDGVRMADRQLAEGLSRHAPVVYVEPPTSVLTRFRKHAAGTRVSGPRVRVEGEVTVLSPLVLPGVSRAALRPVTAALVALQVRRVARRAQRRVDVVLDSDVLSPIMLRLGRVTKVYWAQDDYVGMGELVGLDPAALARGEQFMSRAADLVVAANPVVADSIRRRGRHAELIPFGCDHRLFAGDVTPAADVTLARPLAVFMGHLGERIDFALLSAVVDRGVNVLLVGPQHPHTRPPLLQDVLTRPNVQWVGPQDFERLPEYLAHAAVGLLPYNKSPFNVGSFPLKTLEYLAAGLPVVATSLPAIDWLSCPDIVVANEPQDYADAVERLLAAGPDDAARRRRRDFAALHTWDRRADAVARLVGLAVDEPAPEPGATR